MIDPLSHARLSASVGVETPAFSLVFLDCFTDLIVVINLNAFPFFQLNFTFIFLKLNKPSL